jgi:hypothetical protein
MMKYFFSVSRFQDVISTVLIVIMSLPTWGSYYPHDHLSYCHHFTLLVVVYIIL